MPKRKTNDQFLKEIAGRGITPLERYIKARVKISFKCDACDFEWRAYPFSILAGIGCPECGRIKRGVKLYNKIINEHCSWIEVDVSTPTNPTATMLIDKVDWISIRQAGGGRISMRQVYPAVRIDNRLISVHKFILPTATNVDHINGNPCDNRRKNLRACSNMENSRNSKIFSNSSSGVTGVSWERRRECWRAYITIDYRQINLGSFNRFKDAVAARKAAEIKYFGEFRYKQN